MPIMGITYWTIMIGFMAGAIAKFIMPKIEQGGIFTTMALGLTGAVFFQWLGSALKLYTFGDPEGLIAAVIGALSILIMYYFYIATYGYKFPPKSSKL